MKHDLVKKLSMKKHACLCVVSLTANLAEENAYLTCCQGTKVDTGVKATVPVTAPVTASTGVGVDKESFNDMTLTQGKLSLFVLVANLLIVSPLGKVTCDLIPLTL